MTIGWIDNSEKVALARVVAHASARLAQRYKVPYNQEKMGSVYLRHSEIINAGQAKLLYRREEQSGAKSFAYRLTDDMDQLMFPIVKEIAGVGLMICTYLTLLMIEENLKGNNPKITLL
jgi:hypothetical protein